jgi:hypothetical protein
VTARRALTPAARGVSLAVLAALRGGRVDLADQADGSTLATSTAPDGTELLRAVLHMPVRGHDPRQLTLPAVAPVPVPAEVPPAPVATPAAAPEPEAPAAVEALAPQRDEHNGIAVGDVVSLDDELIRVTVSDEYGWQGVTVATTPLGRPLANVHCDWDDVERVGDRAWRTKPTREKLRSPIVDGPPVSKGAKKAAKKAAKPKAAKAAPEDTETTRINGLAVGDQITLDDELVEVMGLDDDGWTWRTVGDDPRTRDEGECLWSEVEHVEGNRWRARSVDIDETPAQQREAAKAAKPKRAAKAPKAVPARNVPVPEADDLAIYGERSVVAIIHEGGPWELVWSDALPGQMTYDVAVSAVMAQAHAARVYHRGKRCVRDSRDRGAK